MHDTMHYTAPRRGEQNLMINDLYVINASGCIYGIPVRSFVT